MARRNHIAAGPRLFFSLSLSRGKNAGTGNIIHRGGVVIAVRQKRVIHIGPKLGRVCVRTGHHDDELDRGATAWNADMRTSVVVQ